MLAPAIDSFYHCIDVIKGSYILIDVDEQPSNADIYPGVIGYGINSDDIFTLENAPDKTILIDSEYIKLECAHFLNVLEYYSSIYLWVQLELLE